MKLPTFYIDVLIAYNKCKTLPNYELLNGYQLLTQPLWGNTLFQVKGECLFSKAWANAKILYVKDLVNENGSVKTEDELYDSIDDKRNIMKDLFTIKKSVIKKIRKKDLSNAPYTKIRHNTSILYQNRYHRVELQKSKFYYN